MTLTSTNLNSLNNEKHVLLIHGNIYLFLFSVVPIVLLFSGDFSLIDKRIKCQITEREQYIGKRETDKSAIAKHCWERNIFDLNSAKIIFKTIFFQEFYIYKDYKNIDNCDLAIFSLSYCAKY